MSFYRFAQVFLKILFKIYFRMEVYGVEELNTKTSNFLLISNHKCYLDVFSLGMYMKRQVFFMAKKELFRYPIFKNIIKILGAFPVDRGSSKGGTLAIEKAVEILKRGDVVAVFPEGHMNGNDEKFLKPKTGFVRIAVASNVGVVPCSVKYESIFPKFIKFRRWLPFTKICVRYGKEVNVSEMFKKNFKEVNAYEIRDVTLKIWKNVEEQYNL